MTKTKPKRSPFMQRHFPYGVSTKTDEERLQRLLHSSRTAIVHNLKFKDGILQTPLEMESHYIQYARELRHKVLNRIHLTYVRNKKQRVSSLDSLSPREKCSRDGLEHIWHSVSETMFRQRYFAKPTPEKFHLQPIERQIIAILKGYTVELNTDLNNEEVESNE